MAALDIVIVNWNSGGCLRACIAALRGAFEATPGLIRSVTVVDNASADDSLDGLEGAALPLHILRNADNRGFGAACNQGAAGGMAQYLLFLNPDAVATAAALRLPLDFMERPRHDGVGICGVQLLDDSGKIARTCARFPTPAMFAHAALGLDRLFPRRFPRARMAEWDHAHTRAVDQVIGAYFVIRRALFERIGGFDERYFVYFEEVDLSYRARQAGYASVYLTGATASHRGGGSSDRVKARRLYYSLRSRLLFAFKHFTLRGVVAVTLLTLLVEPATRLGEAILRRQPGRAAETMKGYAWLWAWLPRYLFLGRTD